MTLISSRPCDWTTVYLFEIPEDLRFMCKWLYSVDSYAGDRLYKYDETREVEQKAKYVRVKEIEPEAYARIHKIPIRKITAAEALLEIAVLDEDRVEIKRRNVGSNRDVYDKIVDMAKDEFNRIFNLRGNEA